MTGPTFSIRAATTADTTALLLIYAPIVEKTAVSFESETPGIAEFARRIAAALRHHAWLVAEDANGIAGYAYGGPHRQRFGYRYSVETSVYVAEAARGGGIGRALYRALLDELGRRGYRQAYAGITLPNDASEALHAAAGFTRIGVFPNVGHKFGRWQDVAWWHLELPQPDP
ncbi:MAG: N-acetyltransferase family protein [Pseudomonadota bacterium]